MPNQNTIRQQTNQENNFWRTMIAALGLKETREIYIGHLLSEENIYARRISTAMEIADLRAALGEKSK